MSAENLHGVVYLIGGEEKSKIDRKSSPFLSKETPTQFTRLVLFLSFFVELTLEG